MTSVPPPSKEIRRFHHKSRYGCFLCKQRRIKCDETKPVCGNCTQRGFDCSLRYLSQPWSDPLGRTSNVSLLGRIPTRISETGIGPSFCRRGTRDLELYCHFRAHTAGSFSHLPRLQSIWREALPELAGSFPFIGHGLLSVAYIHMASLSPDTSRSLLAESAFHVDQAVPQYSEVIKNINKDNAAALFGFAMFINVITMENVSEECGAVLQVARNVPSKRPETIKRLAMQAVRVIHGQQGIFSIFSRFQRWISNSLLYPAVQRHGAPMLREPTTSWISVEDGRLARLSLLWKRNTAVPATESQALCAALNSLRATFAVVTQLTVPAPA